uniref:Uncharacterized protein n=1 Tax=Romanomermis culicivorax TaxID=13658 RepID=A0A915I324_ROMCU
MVKPGLQEAPRKVKTNMFNSSTEIAHELPEDVISSLVESFSQPHDWVLNYLDDDKRGTFFFFLMKQGITSLDMVIDICKQLRRNVFSVDKEF